MECPTLESGCLIVLIHSCLTESPLLRGEGYLGVFVVLGQEGPQSLLRGRGDEDDVGLEVGATQHLQGLQGQSMTMAEVCSKRPE